MIHQLYIENIVCIFYEKKLLPNCVFNKDALCEKLVSTSNNRRQHMVQWTFYLSKEPECLDETALAET